MPGQILDENMNEPCRRCRENVSLLVVRSEPLCRECFTRYVHTKAIKRLESFRVRNAAPDSSRNLLLALSFGVSSLTLLHILDHQLKTQMSKTGRTGFTVSVVFVEVPGEEMSISTKEVLDKAKAAYPNFEYTALPLHDIFLTSSSSALLNLAPNSTVDENASPSDKLANLIKSLDSATARADVISTLTTRLIVEHAKSTHCEAILWGDSTTKLAEKTLSETAKGRGFSLPWQVSDGESPFGLTFHYPLRDVLKKELIAYIDTSLSPALKSLVHEPMSIKQSSMSSKNTTIDDLMRKYFEDVEASFPSIVSNVVRTTGKLETKAVPADALQCELCGMPVADARFGIHGWGGDQQDGQEEAMNVKGARLCYGCTRSIPQPAATG